MNMSSQSWVFTGRETTKPMIMPKECKYLCYAHQATKMYEKEREKQNHHYQSMCQMEKIVRGRTIQSMFKEWKPAHIAPTFGTQEQARSYIIDGHGTNLSPAIEIGEFNKDIEPYKKKQGTRSDIRTMIEMIKEGKSWIEIVEEVPNAIKMESYLERYRVEYAKSKEKKIEWPIKLPWCTIEEPKPENRKRHFWIWGKANLGKTHMIQEATKDMKVFMPEGQDFPFEDYNGQQLVILDDSNIDMTTMISCTNTWYANKQVAGKTRYKKVYWPRGQTRTMIIVSNDYPDEYMKDDRFNTRFNVIKIEAN